LCGENEAEEKIMPNIYAKFGTVNNDKIFGNGYDYVYGYGGDDTIYKSLGYGHVYGGAGTDTLDFKYADQGATVYMYGGSSFLSPYHGAADSGYAYTGGSFHAPSTGHLGNAATNMSFTFSSIENISGSKFDDVIVGNYAKNALRGGDGNDSLSGSGGNDKIYGGAGIDYIAGGTGVDKLYGGAGSDIFAFSTDETGDVYGDKADHIMDFRAVDTIRIDAYLEFAGSTSAPSLGEYSVWEKDGDHVVTWKTDEGYHDIVVTGDDPTACIEVHHLI
jgi:Ca2+-binding RTX toxin-like protein